MGATPTEPTVHGPLDPGTDGLEVTTALAAEAGSNAEADADEVAAEAAALIAGETSALWASFVAAQGEERRQLRDQLISKYAPIVNHVASRMIVRLPDTVELGDLVSYGVFGLIDAVEKFEPGRGFKFETYAVTRIRGAIIDELRAADWVPRSVRAKARNVETATRALEQRLMRRVTDDDVASELGWESSEVRTVRAQVALSHIGALDTLGTDVEGSAADSFTALSIPGAASCIETREAHALLASAVQGVRDREQEVLHLYYFENLTLAQIGKILGVTESRVSQIHSAAVKKLRETLTKTGAFA